MYDTSLWLGGKEYKSRLIVGTGKYPSFENMREAIEASGAISANTRAINYMGLPSVSVPCGFDSKGLPIGFQIQGRPFAEARVLKVADAYQRDTDWHERVPVLAAV